MTDSGKVGENDSLDFDNLFCDFPPDGLHFLDEHDDSSDGRTPNSHPSDNAAFLSIGDIEDLLLNDDFQEPLTTNDTDAFLSDLLVDSPPTVEEGSDSSASFSRSPPAVQDNNTKDCSSSGSEEKDQHHDNHQQEEEDHGENNDADDHNDPILKKRKRQLRNRDAAVRSRERKKMYVKDLEMKSKYYEAECRRLQWMLQCLRAENHALQFALHSNRQAFGTPTTKQESAVLLLELLLLGSLLWLVGIISLFMVPKQLLANIEAALVGNVEGKNQRSPAPGKKGSKMFGKPVVFQSHMKSKRWRGSRTRMKVLAEEFYRCSMSIPLCF